MLPLRSQVPLPNECQRCGHALTGTYCANCGEKRVDATDYSLKALAHEAVHQFVEVDGSIFRTVRALFTRPGLLTAEYFAGRKSLYTKPLALFVTLNLIFFVIQPHTGLLHWNLDEYGNPAEWNAHPVPTGIASTRRALFVKYDKANEPIGTFRARFESTIQDNKKSMLIVSVPLFALCLQFLLWPMRRYFVEHLVFSIHCFAFVLAYMGVGLIAFLTVLGWTLYWLHLYRFMAPFNTQNGLITMLFLGISAYLYLAVRRFYGLTRPIAFVSAVMLCVMQQFLLLAFRDLVFWATLWTM